MSPARLALIGAGAGGLAWLAWRSLQAPADQVDAAAAPADAWGSAGGVLASAGDGVLQLVDRATGGALRLSAMAQVTGADVIDPQVQAMLQVIRLGEGTADVRGYSRLFGGGQFDGMADHPRRKVTASGYTSTAAGAYQFLASTWDETKAIMGLVDFTPPSQDRAAVGRMAARGALRDVQAGALGRALPKLAMEWASLPGSPYGQPTINAGQALQRFVQAGGVITEA